MEGYGCDLQGWYRDDDQKDWGSCNLDTYEQHCGFTPRQACIINDIYTVANRMQNIDFAKAAELSGTDVNEVEGDLLKLIDSAVSKLWDNFTRSYVPRLEMLQNLRPIEIHNFANIALHALKQLKSIMLQYSPFWRRSFEMYLSIVENAIYATRRIERALFIWRSEAFAMGGHDRLGANSGVNQVEPDLLHEILQKMRLGADSDSESEVDLPQCVPGPLIFPNAYPTHGWALGPVSLSSE
jgi:hypothetical protein